MINSNPNQTMKTADHDEIVALREAVSERARRESLYDSLERRLAYLDSQTLVTGELVLVVYDDEPEVDLDESLLDEVEAGDLVHVMAYEDTADGLEDALARLVSELIDEARSSEVHRFVPVEDLARDPRLLMEAF